MGLEPNCGLAPDLTYGSLRSARSLGEVWRVGVELDAVTIDQKYRAVTPHLLVLDHDHVSVVQHQPISVEPGRDDGVIFFPSVVPQDDDAKVIGGNPRLLEGNELCDCVVFAVAGTDGEGGQGRTSDIICAVKR